MAPDIFQILVQSRQSKFPVKCTQMIGTTDFVSQMCENKMFYLHKWQFFNTALRF